MTNKNNIQLLWGIALILMGIGVFLTIPQKIQQIEHLTGNPTFAKICLYILSAALTLGGIKKILQFKKNGDI